ncbi:MAG: trypsin-like peptidase domain-containing protein [Myxococcales bacterium]|nr:trypsin-like peptidase domain-containing protein [Myxococcales bacterium]
MKTWVYVGVALCASCTSLGETNTEDGVGRADAALIFDDDSRRDYYDHDAPWLRERTLRSVMAVVNPDRLVMIDRNDIRLTDDAMTIGEREDLCPDVDFEDQPTLANCSATLIGEDLVLTAGHCLGEASDCSQYAFAFNYFYESEGKFATMTAEDIYYCRNRIVYNNSGGIDHAIVQIDRPVHPRHRPAAIRYNDEALALDTPVAISGFGLGLPAKLDDEGIVVSNEEEMGVPTYFETTLDVFPGNSGSGVYLHSDEVVGVLVRSPKNHIEERPDADCNQWLVASSGNSGNDVSHVARAIEELCEDVQHPTILCADQGALCKGCDACTGDEKCHTLVGDPNTSYCTVDCTVDADCAAGLACDGGQCLPRPACYGGNLWLFDACGRPRKMQGACSEDAVCKPGAFACTAAGPGNSCEQTEELELKDATIRGTLGDDYRSNFNGSCGGLGQDRVYPFTTDKKIRFRATVTGFDTVLYLRRTCDDPASEILCRDDTTPPGDKGTRLEETLEPGQYFLILDSDGFEPVPGGDFELEIKVTDLSDDEEPDDAGTSDGGVGGKTKDPGGDGCSVHAGPPSSGGTLVWILAGLAVVARVRRHRAGAIRDIL